MPELSFAAQAFTRVAYGLLLLGFLGMTLPHARRFFLSERWGGYAKSAPDVDAIQNPIVGALAIAAWIASALCLVLGWWVLAASLANLLLCRYFFVRMRWRGVARGLGAPGFMTYWLAAVVVLLELTARVAPDVRSLALLTLRVDFAFIMLSAGLYKLSAGYASNHGMELGMANPEWGYWWRVWKRVPPSHWVFRLLNHLAWSTEIVAAVLRVMSASR